jgi:chloramphenicol-sensitive protein RarD
MAVWWFNEPLDQAKIITFIFVWLALAVFSIDSYRAYRSTKALVALK